MHYVSYVSSTLLNIILFLVTTLVIASLTLIERKLLSLVQRRVGPNFVGYKGRLQYLADAVKLFIKGIVIPENANTHSYILTLTVVTVVIYSFWLNSSWGPSISIFELEYNLIYASILSILFSFCIVLVGIISKNKYSVLGSVRCAVLVLNLEIFLGLMSLNLVMFTKSFALSVFVLYQEIIWFLFPLLGVASLMSITFLLETSRAPFDLAEAESEIVAGYSVEIGGFYFALYYLGEYLHLFFFSSIISTLFLGGWETCTLLKSYILYEMSLLH